MTPENSIAPEILYTLAGAWVVFLVLVVKLLRGAFKRKRLRQDLELVHALKLKTAKNTARSEALQQLKSRTLKKKSPAGFGFFIQVLFSLLLLIGGSFWTYLLIQRGFIEWGLLSALMALVGLFLPFLVWRGLRNRNQMLERIDAGLSYLENHSSSTTRPNLVSNNDRTRTLPKDFVPEDSILKRHYLTELDARRWAITNPYPTDSILRRHALPIAQQALNQSQSGLGMQQSQVVTAKLPEDSILRRHYLTELEARSQASSHC